MTAPAVASAFAVIVAGAAVLLIYDLGHFSAHMMLHIASMSVAAPLLAAWAIARRPTRGISPAWLWISTLVQIVLLWTWHSPAVHHVTVQSPALGLALHGVLLLAALSFWFSLLTISAAARWQTIPALVLTGKLACLLAALLIFAPRTLYESAGHIVHAAESSSAFRALDDQHLAGLLMITACPLSYLVAAVMITVQLIGRPQTAAAALERHNLPAGR
ncbi:cytochrome c oxidase assembly protein [Bradyrhizobium sp.]|uniref:cytochrome c oxidase assembly protein n=1 Tax=Bradyrhizobium sp. TaxID=376 RepID=UPI0025C31BD2|nr:cytochrome c oxidase assembly protein [Bradyrhizobium sp.]